MDEVQGKKERGEKERQRYEDMTEIWKRVRQTNVNWKDKHKWSRIGKIFKKKEHQQSDDKANEL